MDPINYSTDVATPFASALQGYQAGAAIRNDQMQQQQQQVAQAQQLKQQQLLAGLANKPNATADDYASVMTQIPSIAEHLQKAWTTKSTAQQQAHAADILQWGAAIKSGKPEFAVEQMTARADLMEQAGGPRPESQVLRTLAQAIQVNPQFGLGQIQAMLIGSPLGKDAAEALSKFGVEARAQELHPGLVAKGTADAAKAGSEATTAATTAKFAEPAAIAELELKGWNVKNIQSEIGYRKDSSRIAAMTAAAAREGNALKREELGLKITEARNTLDDKIRGKAAEAEAGAASMDNFLNTADKFLTMAVDKDGKHTSTLRAAVGTLDSRLPTLSQDVSDLEALAETLGSQAFLSQVPSMKGLGALTEAEGAKLQSSLVNLSLKQSPAQIVANVKEAQRLILKGRKTLELRTGVKLQRPDTPDANPTGGEVDALLKKYGG